MTTKGRTIATLCFTVVAACSAPALLADLSDAETHRGAGDYQAALSAYQSAMASCQTIEVSWRRTETCAAARIGHAELLEELGRLPEAAAAYEAIAPALDFAPVPSSLAYYRAGRIYLQLGRDKRAYTLLWKTITDTPEEGFAADALRLVVADGRKRNVGQLYQTLALLVEPLDGTDVGDNILFEMAKLAERDYRDLSRARAHYDQIVAAYPTGNLVDDAMWHSARLSRALGDFPGAATRYRQLLATREVSLGVGSYFSVWLDNAQLELGRLLRDQLGDARAAIDVFEELPIDYPASVLRDDALYELAVTWQRLAKPEQACRALARLHDSWPNSKYELSRAPSLRRQLGCAPM